MRCVNVFAGIIIMMSALMAEKAGIGTAVLNGEFLHLFKIENESYWGRFSEQGNLIDTVAVADISQDSICRVGVSNNQPYIVSYDSLSRCMELIVFNEFLDSIGTITFSDKIIGVDDVIMNGDSVYVQFRISVKVAKGVIQAVHWVSQYRIDGSLIRTVETSKLGFRNGWPHIAQAPDGEKIAVDFNMIPNTLLLINRDGTVACSTVVSTDSSYSVYDIAAAPQGGWYLTAGFFDSTKLLGKGTELVYVSDTGVVEWKRECPAAADISLAVVNNSILAVLGKLVTETPTLPELEDSLVISWIDTAGNSIDSVTFTGSKRAKQILCIENKCAVEMNGDTLLLFENGETMPKAVTFELQKVDVQTKTGVLQNRPSIHLSDKTLMINSESGISGGVVRLFNYRGQQVLFSRLEKQHTALDLSSLGKGSYLIECILNGIAISDKIVVD